MKISDFQTDFERRNNSSLMCQGGLIIGVYVAAMVAICWWFTP